MNGNSKIASKPVTATDKDLRRAMAIADLLVQPLGILPAAVGDPIRPVAIGFFQQVSPYLSPGESVTALRRAIGAYVHSKRYYLACSRPDAMRHDINGEPVEPVSDSDQLNAQKRLQIFREQKSQTPAPAIVAAPVAAAENKRDLIRASLLGRSRS
ncbi:MULTISPECIES: ProQ/FINO family protein [Brucella/Ochrobactrum group]|uniref:ProQ/FINO family protein n=2 Tax=Brucella/Ochrobactrum group TaxID=2826938 RepID=A0ABT3QTJ9_9HYPH|nr:MULTISPECIES: ProQ/FINO family protein [Brucella/Ochrobactrum group]KAB2739930.1 ProQ/FINO family protein [Brucella anthropi]MCX2698947.1 ProQ/FINO family protein [Ochrobactrum chromiisoli]TMU91172.1 ProQ/FINO family protein [Brucella haematophila]